MKRSWRIISFILTLMIVNAATSDYSDYWEDSVDVDLESSMYINEAFNNLNNGNFSFIDSASLIEGYYNQGEYEWDKIGGCTGSSLEDIINTTLKGLYDKGASSLASSLSFYQALFTGSTLVKYNANHKDILSELGFTEEVIGEDTWYNGFSNEYIVSMVSGVYSKNEYVFLTRSFINLKTNKNYYAFLTISRDPALKDPIGYGLFTSDEIFIPVTQSGYESYTLTVYNDLMGKLRSAIVELASDPEVLNSVDLDSVIEYIDEDVQNGDTETTHYSIGIKYHTFCLEKFTGSTGDIYGYTTGLVIDGAGTKIHNDYGFTNNALYSLYVSSISLSSKLFSDTSINNAYVPKASIDNIQDSLAISDIDHDNLAKSITLGDMYYTKSEILFGDVLKAGASNMPEISEGLVGDEDYSKPMAELSGNIIRAYCSYMINNTDGNFFDENGKPILPDGLFQTKAFKKIIEQYLEYLKKALKECTEAANEAAAANEWASLDEVMFDSEYDLMSSIVQQRVAYEFDPSKKFKGSTSGLSAYFQKVKIGSKR